jgi:Ca-activated chloride channel homolog
MRKMTIYRLDNPLALLFLLLPLLSLFIIITQRFIYKKGVKFSGVSEFHKIITLPVIGYYSAILLIIAGFFFIAFSLTKPQYGIKREKIISNGIDIMISLDVSYSMTTRDFLMQSRIDGAKRIIEDFIDKRKGDRIGLVTFGESSFLKCPVTLNFKLLKNVVERVVINPNNSHSTAIGVGLASSINRLLSIQNTDENPKSQSQIVILVTDGINNSGEISPQAAMEIAVQKNIKLYTIGVGSGEEVDTALLSSMANKTGGKFFHANTSGDLGNVFDEIDKIEKHKIESLEYTRFKDTGYQYAVFGIIILLAGIFINTLFFKRLG